MSAATNKGPQDALTPEEFRGWLSQEIRDSSKAHELRVKEATEFVTAYTSGDISPEEAMKRLRNYDQRWGEALYGAMATPEVSDEQIISAIDQARAKQNSVRRIRTSTEITNSGSSRLR
jgi:hypothetical protein